MEILSRLRKADPAQAREWVSAVWKREKVDARVAFLETFEVGLGAEDEDLLDIALGDKTERVREVAARLLISLPTSALAGRMRARAEAMLTLKNGALDAKPPTAVDAEWERDGLTEKGGQGARAARVLDGAGPQSRAAVALGGAVRHGSRRADRRDGWLEMAYQYP